MSMCARMEDLLRYDATCPISSAGMEAATTAKGAFSCMQFTRQPPALSPSRSFLRLFCRIDTLLGAWL